MEANIILSLKKMIKIKIRIQVKIKIIKDGFYNQNPAPKTCKIHNGLPQDVLFYWSHDSKSHQASLKICDYALKRARQTNNLLNRILFPGTMGANSPDKNWKALSWLKYKLTSRDTFQKWCLSTDHCNYCIPWYCIINNKEI